MFPEYLSHRLSYVYARAAFWIAAHKSDRIFTVSEQSKRDILKFLKVPPEKIVVTPNAIDDRFGEPPSEKHVAQIARPISVEPLLHSLRRQHQAPQESRTPDRGVSPRTATRDDRSSNCSSSATRSGNCRRFVVRFTSTTSIDMYGFSGLSRTRRWPFCIVWRRSSSFHLSVKASACLRSKPWPAGRLSSRPMSRRCRKWLGTRPCWLIPTAPRPLPKASSRCFAARTCATI